MTTATRVFVAIAVTATLLVFGAVGATASLFHRAGNIVVELQPASEQPAVSLKIPAAFVRAAVAMVPDCAFEDVSREVGPFLPVARAAVDQLSRTPDTVFVEVRGSDEHVRVSKKGNTIVVDVDSDGDRVHIEVPLSMVSSLLEHLEDAAGDTVPSPSGDEIRVAV